MSSLYARAASPVPQHGREKSPLLGAIALLPDGPLKMDEADMTFGRRIGLEVLSLLKWSMLAACTIGPGTVIVCSKAGAEFNLQLLWTLIVASFVAFMLQKEAARLTIVSGMSFGQAIRRRFSRKDPNKVPVIGYFAIVGVFIGNTAYEANSFVGAMAALYVLYKDVVWFRIILSAVLGGATLLALLYGNIDQIGQALGVVIMSMTIVFAVSAGFVEVDGNAFGNGLLPNIPAGGSVTVLSMMATTCIPFNMFLAASMVGDGSEAQMTRGIAFASVMTAIISVLIVIIGSDITVAPDEDFDVEDLGQAIYDKLGKAPQVLFCLGLYAAAYSTGITCPLGAALTAQQILCEGRDDLGTSATLARRALSHESSETAEGLLPVEDDGETPPATPPTTPPQPALEGVATGSTGNGMGASVGDTGIDVDDRDDDGDDDDSALLGDGAVTPTKRQRKQREKGGSNSRSGSTDSAGGDGTGSSGSGGKEVDLTGINRWQTGGLFFKLSLWGCVGVAVVVSASGAPTVPIIIMAQVINGLLLPCLAVCLFLCLNDADIMHVQPTLFKNAVMLLCVTITSFLAFHLVLDELSRAVAGPQASNGTNHSFGPTPNTSGNATPIPQEYGAWDPNLSIAGAGVIAVLGSAFLAVNVYYEEKKRQQTYHLNHRDHRALVG